MYLGLGAKGVAHTCPYWGFTPSSALRDHSWQCSGDSIDWSQLIWVNHTQGKCLPTVVCLQPLGCPSQMTGLLSSVAVHTCADEAAQSLHQASTDGLRRNWSHHGPFRTELVKRVTANQVSQRKDRQTILIPERTFSWTSFGTYHCFPVLAFCSVLYFL